MCARRLKQYQNGMEVNERFGGGSGVASVVQDV